MRAAFLLLLFSSPVLAADLHVQTGDSIQSAISIARAGDRVLVAPGTYVEQIDFLGKSIELIGLGGATATVLDGGGLAPVVRFVNGEGSSTKLRGFTVTGGVAAMGAGGIGCAAGAAPTIEDCIVRNNHGRYGGGISGSPILRRCAVVDNGASLTHGGGIYGAPQMSHCVVARNHATSAYGGGIYLVGGSASIRDCVIIENSAVLAGSKGGGVYVDSTAPVVIERSVVAFNYATGGVYAGAGGGLLAESASASVVDCTVLGNSVSGSSTYGAGLYGPFTVTNTIVRDNLGGPQISNASAVRYSDVQGGSAGVGNVDLDPAFVDALARDYHLLADSPLIDIGDPALLDPDGTRSDIGALAFQTLYTVANTNVEDWFDPSWPEVSVLVGGKQVLRTLAGGAHAGEPFQILGSASGTIPGTVLFGASVPLNPDAYFRHTFTRPQAPFGVPDEPQLLGAAGMLDGDGRAQSTVRLFGSLQSPLAGLTFHHASVVFLPGPALALVTCAEPLTLVP